LLSNAAGLGGDPTRVAVMGESAGANLAANVSIYARNSGLQTPIHQTLVYPVASNNTMSISYEENREAKPLNKPMML
jgi:acetyl esterase